MTNSTSGHKEQPNQYLAEIKELCDDWQSAGHKAPNGFAAMLQNVLALTVLKSGALRVQVSDSKSHFQISGQLKDGRYTPLELNNGGYPTSRLIAAIKKCTQLQARFAIRGIGMVSRKYSDMISSATRKITILLRICIFMATCLRTSGCQKSERRKPCIIFTFL